MALNLSFKLASKYAKLIPQGKIIVVTGSIGKTSTLLACRAVLETVMPTIFEQSILRHPQNLLKITPKIKKGLFEVDPNYEADKVLNLIKPEVVVVTNVLETGFLSTEQLVQELSRLLIEVPKKGVVILNWDDPLSRKLVEKTGGEVIYIGTNPQKCHIWAGNIHISQFRINFELNYGVERIEIATQFISKAQIYSILAATALGLSEGLRLTQIKSAVEKLKPLNHKLEVVQGFNGSTIVDSSFDGAIVSAEQSIDSLNYLPARRRIVVLGPMQGGSGSEKIYRRIAQKIYQDKIDLVLLAKGEVQVVADELLNLGFIPGRLEHDLQNPQIVGSLLKILARGDVVLIKGVKDVRLDEVVAKISKINR